MLCSALKNSRVIFIRKHYIFLTLIHITKQGQATKREPRNLEFSFDLEFVIMIMYKLSIARPNLTKTSEQSFQRNAIAF